MLPTTLQEGSTGQLLRATTGHLLGTIWRWGWLSRSPGTFADDVPCPSGEEPSRGTPVVPWARRSSPRNRRSPRHWLPGQQQLVLTGVRLPLYQVLRSSRHTTTYLFQASPYRGPACPWREFKFTFDKTQMRMGAHGSNKRQRPLGSKTNSGFNLPGYRVQPVVVIP